MYWYLNYVPSKTTVDSALYVNSFFKSVSLFFEKKACNIKDDEEEGAMRDMEGGPWKVLLPPKKLFAHQEHEFGRQSINNCGVVNHVRLTMAPDGGISRMRLFGYIQDPVKAKL